MAYGVWLIAEQGTASHRLDARAIRYRPYAPKTETTETQADCVALRKCPGPVTKTGALVDAPLCD